MPLKEECRVVTAMTTPFGLYQWKVMPMGAKNGNSAFQRMMDWVLKEFEFADAFVDDVIIATGGSDDEDMVEKHKQQVQLALSKFRELGLVCDLEKAQMFVPQVEFCGHVVGNGVRRPSPGKLRSLEKWPQPRNVTELRAFLGF